VRIGEQTLLDRPVGPRVISTSGERALAMVEEQVLKEDENSVPPATKRHYGSTHSRFGGKSGSPGAVL